MAKIKFIIKYFLGIWIIDKAPSIVKAFGLQAGIDFLLKKYRFFKPRSVQFLLLLYRYLLTLEATSVGVSKSQGGYIIHFCCWGERYTEKVEKFLLPSLLAKNNLPKISEKYSVTLSIHGDKKVEHLLTSSAVVGEIKKYAKVVFFLIPNDVLTAYRRCSHYPNFFIFKRVNHLCDRGLRYLLLGGLQCHALVMALQQRAYVSFLMPDTVLSESFLIRAFEKIHTKKMVLTTTFRSDFEKMHPALENYYLGQTQLVLALPEKILMELQLAHMHESAKHQIVSPDTEDFEFTAQLIFKEESGIIIRSFHYHPILVDCSAIHKKIKIDYYPIDFTVINELIIEEQPISEQLWVCDDASFMAIAELSDNALKNRLFYSRQKLMSNELRRIIFDRIQNTPSVYGSKLNHYLISIRHQYGDVQLKDRKGLDQEFFPCH